MSVTFTTPTVITTVKTLILYNPTRMDQVFGAGSVAAADLTNQINRWQDATEVHGEVVNLDSYPAITQAYQVWDGQPGNPQAANFVARTIKSLLYSLAPAYPNAQYIVIVGGDNVIPQRRLVDLTLVANERKYAAKADNALLTAAFQNRYYLSDDYYAATLPYGIAGRELYVPQYGLGRLIESPDEIVAMIDAFPAQATISPKTRWLRATTFSSTRPTRSRQPWANKGSVVRIDDPGQ